MMTPLPASAEQARNDLQIRYPDFAPGKLSEIAIVGAAIEGQRLCSLAAAHGIKITALVDNNPQVAGSTLSGGHEVLGALPADLDPATPIVIASHRVLNATQNLKAQGFTNVLGFGVLQTMYPETFPPHMFYRNWLEDLELNRERYLETYDRLADDVSRSTFNAVIAYRTTGDIEHLAPWVDPVLFYPEDLFSLGTSEIYIDAGAYTGDTIELFVERTNGCFKRVIGFEPDTKNYAEFSKRFADEQRIEAKPQGLFKDQRVLRFGADAGRASGLSETGGTEVPVTSIDIELAGDPATFIKLNIEGAELDALEGARGTIENWHPRLCVSGYHLASHLWEVPAKFCELSNSYEIYLRQHDGGVIESTYYGLPTLH